MCGIYSKTKSDIMKHYQKEHVIFLILNSSSLDFKPLSYKSKPTPIDSFFDKPKALIGTVSSRPYTKLNNF